MRLHDVLAYSDRRRIERRNRVDDLTRQAEEDGLNDMDADSYLNALREARKS